MSATLILSNEFKIQRPQLPENTEPMTEQEIEQDYYDSVGVPDVNSLKENELQFLFMLLAFKNTKFIKSLVRDIGYKNKWGLNFGDGLNIDTDADGYDQFVYVTSQWDQSDIICDPRKHVFPIIKLNDETVNVENIKMMSIDPIKWDNDSTELTLTLIDEGYPTEIFMALMELFHERIVAPKGLDYYKVMYQTDLPITKIKNIVKCTEKHNKQLLALIADNLGIKFNYDKVTKSLLCSKIIKKLNN